MKPIREIFQKEKENKSPSFKKSSLNVIETKEEYFARLERATKNLDAGKGISMSEQEIDKAFVKILKK